MAISDDAQVSNAVPVVEGMGRSTTAAEEAGGGGDPKGRWEEEDERGREWEEEVERIASAAEEGGGDSSRGGGGGRGASGWLGEEEEQVRNLKKNWGRAFGGHYVVSHPWFAEVVAALRADPCLTDNPQLFDGENMPPPLYRMGGMTNLHVAVLLRDLEMVQKVLGTGPIVPDGHDIDSGCGRSIGTTYRPPPTYSALRLAVVCVESNIVDALLNKGAQLTGLNGYFGKGALQVAAWNCAGSEKATEKLIRIIDALVRHGFDLHEKDCWGWSVFYAAVASSNTTLVKKLLEWKDKIKLNEARKGGRPPIQIANQSGLKDMENALMECEDVKRYVESAFRDRQAYVDAANAILVGAALIASVTFASWLQPPLGYTTPYGGGSSAVVYVDVEHNAALGSFWVFNTLSFYFAMGTVVFGAHSVLPRRHLFITENVEKLSQNLFLTSVLLAFSVFFVIVAFGIAGCIVLVPILRYRWYMVAPMIFGGIVCVGSIGYLFKSLWENRPWCKSKRKRDHTENNDLCSLYCNPLDDE